MGKLRVFLADDHPVVREGIKAMVGGHPNMEVVGEAADGLTACERVAALLPDVVVMDVSMPGLNGFQAAERLTRDCPGVKVLAMTVHEDGGYAQQLLAAGVKGYVLKRTAGEGLIHAIQVVAASGVYLDPVIAGKLLSGLGRRPRGDGSPLAEVELSDREAEIVRNTAAGYGNKEIAARLDLSVKTIETYRARAMEKLGLRGRAELVRYAQRRGWLQEV